MQSCSTYADMHYAISRMHIADIPFRNLRKLNVEAYKTTKKTLHHLVDLNLGKKIEWLETSTQKEFQITVNLFSI